MRSRLIFPLALAASLGLLSCARKDKTEPAPIAPPTANVRSPRETTVPEPISPSQATPPDDGMRVGNILALPEEKDFKATNPSVPKSTADSGTVISRPPVEKK